MGSFKIGILKIALHLRDGMLLCDNHWKFWTISILWLWNKFSKKRKLFKKLEYHFLVETTKIDNITFPCKTALSEANVKANRMGSTKLTSLPVTTFLFLKFCFSLGTSYIELIWCTNHPSVHIHTFWKCWSFTLGCFFPVSILKIDVNATKIRNVQDYVYTKN